MNRWMQLLLAMVLGAGAGVAGANSNYLFTMPLAPDLPYSSTVTVAGAGPFTDLWSFTAPAAALSVSASAIAVNIQGWYGIDDMLVRLYDDGDQLIATGAGTAGSSLSDVLIVGGDPYYFSVTGSVTEASGVYSFLAIAAPVPEPETYAMWLAGLAVVGFLVARRRARA
jgi:hypothetical protein